MAKWTVYDDEPYPGPPETEVFMDSIRDTILNSYSDLLGTLALGGTFSAFVGEIEHYPGKLWSERELVEMTREQLTRLGPLDKVYTLDPIGVMYKQIRPLFLTMSPSDRINWTYEWDLT